MTEINDLDDLVRIYEADEINDDLCLAILEKMMTIPILVFKEPGGGYSGGKKTILANLKKIRDQMNNGQEVLIFLNLDIENESTNENN